MATNIAGYISNLGKSVSYSAVDKIKKMTPSTAEFVETNAELFKDVHHSIRDYRGTFLRAKSVFAGSKIYEAGDQLKTSIIEDIKSGKFYNKQREDELDRKVMGLDGDDWDFESDFNDGDSDFGVFDDNTDITSGEKAIASMIGESSRSSADAVSMALVKTGEYIVENQKSNTNILYTQNIRAFNKFNSNLFSINNNIANLLQFSTSTIQSHASNSKIFYEESVKLQQDQVALLRQIAESMTKNDNEQQKKESGGSKSLSYSDISLGGFDIKKYATQVKRNLSGELGAVSSMNDMFGEDSNLLLAFASSPLKFIPNAIINKLTPKVIEKSAANLDKSINGFFGSLMTKFNSMANDDNMIASAIGRILGIRNNVKGEADTGLYNKGKVDWDGISRKALTEVLPMQMSKIISLLSGQAPQIFDYKSGKFVSSNILSQEYRKMRDNFAKDSTSEMKDQFLEYMKAIAFESKKDRDELEKDIDTILSYLYNNQELFNINAKSDDWTSEAIKYGVSTKNYQYIRGMFKNAPRHMKHGINTSIMQGREREDAAIKDIEQSDSMYRHLFNNFGFNNKEKDQIVTGLSSNSILKSIDDKGRNIFFYLQNMYKELTYIRQAGIMFGGNGEILDFNSIQIPSSNANNKTNDIKQREQYQRDNERFLREQKSRMEKSRLGYVDYSNMDSDDVVSSLDNMLEVRNINSKLKEKENKSVSLIDKLLNATNLSEKTKVFIDQMDQISKKPVEFFARTLDKVDQKLYEAIYGKPEENKHMGFIDSLTYNLNQTFSKFNNWLDETILNPVKDKLNVENFKDVGKKFFGMFGLDVDELSKKLKTFLVGDENEKGIFSKINEEIKNTFKSAGDTIKDAFKDAFGPLVGKIKDKMANKKRLAPQFLLQENEYDMTLAELASIAPTATMNDIVTGNFVSKMSSENTIPSGESEGERRSSRLRYSNIFRGSKLNRKKLLQDSAENTTSMKSVLPTANIFKSISSDIHDIRNLLFANSMTSSKTPIVGLNPNIMKHPEGQAYTDLSNQLSNHIANFMFGSLPKYAEGTGGKSVDKTQIASLSKGEMVLSVEDKDKLINALTELTELVKGEKDLNLADKSLRSAYGSMRKNSPQYLQREFGNMNAEDFMNILKSAHPEQLNKIIGKVESEKLNYGEVDNNGMPVDPVKKAIFLETQPLIKQMLEETKSAFSITKESLFGKSSSQEKKNFGEALDDVMGNVSQYAPGMIATGLLGGGVSILTGAIGGPLVGAAVGAGISLAKNSEKVQNWLFGEMTEDGRKGGLVNKKLMGSIDKYAPDLKTYGIVGGVSGLIPFIPFGPVGGLMLGSAVAFAKNNDSVQKSLFGEEGLFKPEFKQKLNKALPKMGVGAAAAMIAGPFGLLGNALLGSGVGLLASTDKFKEMILGKYNEKTGEYEGGFLPAARKVVVDPLKKFMGTMKNNVFDFVQEHMLKPLKEAFEPLKKQVELMMKGMFDKIGGFLNKMFESSLGIPLHKFLEDKILTPASNIFKTIFKTVMFPVKAVAATPFKLVGAIGTHYRKKQIREGNADYMSAKERNEFRRKKGVNSMGVFGRDKFRQLDSFMEGLSPEQIDEIYGQLDEFVNVKDKLSNKRKELTNDMGARVSQDMHYNKAKKVMKAVTNMDYQSAVDYIYSKKSGLTAEQQDELVSYLDIKYKEYEQVDASKEGVSKIKSDTAKRLRRLGFKDFDETNAKKYLGLFGKEKDFRNKMDTTTEAERIAKSQEMATEKRHNKIVDLLSMANASLEVIANPDKQASKVIVDKFGNEIKLKKGRDGLEVDKTDRSTRQAIKEANAEKETAEQSAENTGFMAKFFSKFKKKDEDEEEETGFFGKIKNFLGGVGGGIKGFFSGKSILGTGAKLVAGMFLGSKLLGLINGNVTPMLGQTWEEHVKPWINDTAIPFVTDKVVPAITDGLKWVFDKGLPTLVGAFQSILPKITEGMSSVVPYIIDGVVKLIPELGKLLGTALGWAITDLLPELVKNSGKIVASLGEGVVEVAKSAINWFKDPTTVKNDTNVKQLAAGQKIVNGKIVGGVTGKKDSQNTDYNNYEDYFTNQANGTSYNNTAPIQQEKKKSKFSLFSKKEDESVSTGSIAGYDISSEISGVSDSAVQNIYNDPSSYNNYSMATTPVIDEQQQSLPTNVQQPQVELPPTGEYVQDENGQMYILVDGLYEPVDIEQIPAQAEVKSINSENIAGRVGKGIFRHLITGGKTSAKFLPKLKGGVGLLQGAKNSGKYGLKAARQMIPGLNGSFKPKAFKSLKYTSKSIWSTTKTAGTAITETAEGIGKQYNKIDDVLKIGKRSISDISGGITKKLASNADNIAGKALNAITSDNQLIKAALNTLQGTMEKLLNNVTVRSIIGKKADTIIETFIPKLLKEASESLAKAGGKLAVKVGALVSTGGLLNIAFAAADFISGFNDAKTTLGIIEEPTFGQKVCCGLLKALSGLFIVTSFIPESTWANLFFDFILPIFGEEDSNIQKLRDEADKTVSEYNKKNGTDYSVKEYNTEVKGDVGFFKKVSNKVQSVFKGNTPSKSGATTNSKNKSSGYNNSSVKSSSYSNSSRWTNRNYTAESRRQKHGVRGGQYEPINSNVKTAIYSGANYKPKVMSLGMGGSSSIIDGMSSSGNSASGGASQTINKSNIRNYKVTSSLGPSVTADQLNSWIASKPSGNKGLMRGQGAAFIEAGRITGLDPRYIAAHAAWESGWGTSQIVRDKNNFFGIAAFNDSPYSSAKSFSTPRDGIIAGAKWIKENFVDGGQDSLHLMQYGKPGHTYAVDNNGKPSESWISGISSIMMDTPGAGNGNSGKLSASGSYSANGEEGEAGTAEAEKPSIWNFFSDLASAGSNAFNRLFGFENSDESSASVAGVDGGTGSLDTSAAKISDKWYLDTLGATVTSPYADRVDPITGQQAKHTGIDYSAGGILGKDIKSPIAGKVFQNTFEGAGFGNYVAITDNNGADHIFGHMQNRSPLSVGSRVSVGQSVGKVGSTGRSTGPHLHYEIRKNGDWSTRYEPNQYLSKIYKNSSVQTSVNEINQRRNASASSGVDNYGADNRMKQPPRDLLPRDEEYEYHRIETKAGANRIREKDQARIRNNKGGESSSYNNLLMSIIQLLSKLVDNSTSDTASMAQIVSILSSKLGVDVSQQTDKVTKNAKNARSMINIINESTKANGGTLDDSSLLSILNKLAIE